MIWFRITYLSCWHIVHTRGNYRNYIVQSEYTCDNVMYMSGQFIMHRYLNNNIIINNLLVDRNNLNFHLNEANIVRICNICTHTTHIPT